MSNRVRKEVCPHGRFHPQIQRRTGQIRANSSRFDHRLRGAEGDDPINQIVGYILSEDPTYITNHNSARTLICKVDRDELLQALVKNYLDID